MKKKFTILALVIFLGLPSVSLAGSFVVSLIQGKTPAEAVQIIAEQFDSLLGRVEVLENKQDQTTARLTSTDADIEKLKLENENLRLKNENLSKETDKISQQVIENEKAIDIVKQCEILEKPRVCAQNSIELANKQINSPDLLPTATFDEVTSVIDKISYLNGTWYSKTQTDEICWKFSYGGQEDRCKSREAYIQEYNEHQRSSRERAPSVLKQGTEILKSSQVKFDELQCEVLLKKYVPNRSVPGCG